MPHEFRCTLDAKNTSILNLIIYKNIYLVKRLPTHIPPSKSVLAFKYQLIHQQANENSHDLLKCAK